MDRKYLPLKIVHMILMAAAFVMCVLVVVKSSNGTTVSPATTFEGAVFFIILLAIIIAFVYLIRGSKKQYSYDYKIFMVLYLCVAGFTVANLMCLGEPIKAVHAVVLVIPVVTGTMLATGKDLGKNKTLILGAITVLCNVFILIYDVACQGTASDLGFKLMALDISTLLLTLTLVFMVIEKYLDKQARGSK